MYLLSVSFLQLFKTQGRVDNAVGLLNTPKKLSDWTQPSPELLKATTCPWGSNYFCGSLQGPACPPCFPPSLSLLSVLHLCPISIILLVILNLETYNPPLERDFFEDQLRLGLPQLGVTQH